MTNFNETIAISAQPSTSPNVCRFEIKVSNQPYIFSKTEIFCSRNLQMLHHFQSPLLKNFFEGEDIGEVHIDLNKITIKTISQNPDWKVQGKIIGQKIRNLILQKNEDPLKEFLLIDELKVFKTSKNSTPHEHKAPDWENKSPEEKKIFQKLQVIFETEINPQVASHGGKIEVIDFADGIVSVKMQGGCQGCGQATLTLYEGVEKTLKSLIPQVKSLKDITDHSSGQNPYA
jgi:Fe-S cluster biogenesis protein NfuA